jgi:hypothetical protein
MNFKQHFLSSNKKHNFLYYYFHNNEKMLFLSIKRAVWGLRQIERTL